MKLGVQIYGCLQRCKQDTDGFFEKIAGAGYSQIEPCMVFGLKEVPEKGSLMDAVWKPAESHYYTALLRKHGLSLRSCHVFAEDPLSCVDEMRSAAEAYGISQYVLNCPSFAEVSWEDFANDCSALAEALPVELWLHNGHAEIAVKEAGVTLYEKILHHCAGRLGAQVDVGWALYGGEDPLALLDRIKDYLRSVHYKDIENDYKTRSSEDIRACLGEGALPTAAIHAHVAPLGITELIDQDKSYGDIVEDQLRSAKAFSLLTNEAL